jgi:hypothetical protein
VLRADDHHVEHQQILIGSVQDRDGRLVVACRSCGWASRPVRSGRACGEQWDAHLAQAHGRVPAGA